MEGIATHAWSYFMCVLKLGRAMLCICVLPYYYFTTFPDFLVLRYVQVVIVRNEPWAKKIFALQIGK